jgi:DNA-binding MarR family transcriptional regulator
VIGGPASVSELAERIGLTPATTSLLVGELSRTGFVQRQEDEADRRRTIVSVDKSIEDVVRPSLGETLEPLDRALARMSAVQRTHFMDGLRILNEEIGRSEGNGQG